MEEVFALKEALGVCQKTFTHHNGILIPSKAAASLVEENLPRVIVRLPRKDNCHGETLALIAKAGDAIAITSQFI